MTKLKLALLAAFALAACATATPTPAPSTQPTHPVTAERNPAVQVDALVFLPPPPQADGALERAERDIVRGPWSAERRAQALEDNAIDPYAAFDSVLGPNFPRANTPLTFAPIPIAPCTRIRSVTSKNRRSAMSIVRSKRQPKARAARCICAIRWSASARRGLRPAWSKCSTERRVGARLL